MKTLVAALIPLLAVAPASAAEKAQAPFGLDQLRAAVETSGATRMEDIAGILSRALGANFTAIYRSESTQGGTPKAPRILFWDERSGFAATFNGDATEKEFNTLELMQFDPKEAKFHFLRQEFPLTKDANGNVAFAPKEEHSCLACHGSDPRPIWSEYPTWPGSFGSDDDLVHGKEETELYKSFRSAAVVNPIYRPLFALADHPPYRATPFPYRDERKSMAKVKASAKYRPNMRLGFLLSRLNVRRALRLIRQTKDYEKNAPLLLYGFMGCDNNGVQSTSHALTELAGLSVLDLDIRVLYPNGKPDSLEAGSSYYDGSGSINELVANDIYSDVAQHDPNLAAFHPAYGLHDKYPPGTPISDQDFAFNGRIDALGKWIPTPFPESNIIQKHRRPMDEDQMENWQGVCAALAKRLPPAELARLAPPNPPIPGRSASRNGTAYFHFQNHCASCHAGPNFNRFAIENEQELYEYLRQKGQLMVETVEKNSMPKGKSHWSDTEKEDWARDRPLLLELLRKLTEELKAEARG